MSDRTRIKLAAVVTALFLAAVSAAGLTTHSSRVASASPPASTAAATVASRGHGQARPVTTWGEQEHD